MFLLVVRLQNNLILQKIHALRYLEDEVQGSCGGDAYGESPAVLGAYFLSRHANATWLLDNISQVIHLLNADDVLNISKRLVEHILGCLKLNRDAEFVLAKMKNFCTMSQEIR